MAVHIALGILLGIGMIVGGIAALAILAIVLNAAWEYLLVAGILAIGYHFIGAWILLPLLGFLVVAEIRNPTAKSTTETGGEIEQG